MKIYTVFTESHMPLFRDYFIKTLPFQENVELVVKFKPQLCKSSEFRSDGWRDTMKYKVDCFIKASEETPYNEIFMFSDPDIQFFKPFKEDVIKHLEGYDIVFQNDWGGGVNTGFFAVKNSPKIYSFFKTVEMNLDKFQEEQECTNHLLRSFNEGHPVHVKWQFLPKEYWTYGEQVVKAIQNNKQFETWSEGIDFEIPDNIIMHHANWTKTFADKFKILDLTRKKYNAKIS